MEQTIGIECWTIFEKMDKLTKKDWKRSFFEHHIELTALIGFALDSEVV